MFEGSKLIYHAVEVIAGNSSQEIFRNGRRTFRRLIADFRPQLIAIEKPYFINSKHSLLHTLILQMKRIAKREDMEVTEIAASTVKKFLTADSQASKEEVCKAVISKHPELKPYRTHERKWKTRYHQNRFDAVAVGMTYFSNY